jgi:hypothetical protein
VTSLCPGGSYSMVVTFAQARHSYITTTGAGRGGRGGAAKALVSQERATNGSRANPLFSVLMCET